VERSSLIENLKHGRLDYEKGTCHCDIMPTATLTTSFNTLSESSEQFVIKRTRITLRWRKLQKRN